MNLQRLTNALTQLLQLGSYANCTLRIHEDDQRSDFWYLLMVDKVVQYPGTYVNLNGSISATFLLDATLKALSVQALFTLDNRTGDITCHQIGHGKLHLPGIANSVGMKYGIVDVEMSVTQFLQTSLPTSKVPVNFSISAEVIEKATSRCECGGRKAGYSDTELHGHGSWCPLVTEANKVTHGNGD